MSSFQSKSTTCSCVSTEYALQNGERTSESTIAIWTRQRGSRRIVLLLAIIFGRGFEPGWIGKANPVRRIFGPSCFHKTSLSFFREPVAAHPIDAQSAAGGFYMRFLWAAGGCVAGFKQRCVAARLDDFSQLVF